MITETESVIPTQAKISKECEPTVPPVEEVDRRKAQDLLKKIEKDIADYQAAENLTDLDLATTEKSVAKALSRQANENLLSATPDSVASLSSSHAESNSVFIGTVFGVPAALVAAAIQLGMLPTIVHGAIVSLPLILVFFVASMTWDGLTSPYITLRNKVIFRKRFQRDVRSITQRNTQNAERNHKLRAGREKKLARIQQRVQKLAVQYEQNNPGMTLALSARKDEIVEVVKPATTPEPAQSQKALLDRIAPKAVEA